jgi:hypothetical protein
VFFEPINSVKSISSNELAQASVASLAERIALVINPIPVTIRPAVANAGLDNIAIVKPLTILVKSK